VPPNQGIQAWDRYAYVINNPLRYTDPTGHLTDDQIKSLLGKHYNMLMKLWEKDKYWLDILANLEVGGILTASFMPGVELHIEMVDGQIQAMAYDKNGCRWISDIRLWQGKGAYGIRNPGDTDEDVAKNRDEIFNRHSQNGQMISPVFDYCPNGNCDSPQYLGARRTVQSVQPTQQTATGYFGIAPFSEIYGGGLIAYFLEKQGFTMAVPVSIGIGTVDLLVFSTLETYRQPRVYTNGWAFPIDGNFSPDINPYSDFQFP
jgi:hypothetical protein